MRERKELKQFVFVFLGKKKEGADAQEIYETMRRQAPEIIRRDHVQGFKSFVKIINTIPEVKTGEKENNKFLYKINKKI